LFVSSAFSIFVEPQINSDGPSLTFHLVMLPSVMVGDSAGMAKLWAAELAVDVEKAVMGWSASSLFSK